MNPRSPLVIIVGIVVALLILFGVWQVIQGNQAVAPSPEVSTSPSPEAISNEITVNLAEQNESSQSGTAVLKEENGQTTVTITTTGFTEDVSQPAHIHLGACPSVGAVKYPLANVLNGSSTTTLNATMVEIKGNLPLAVNIHKSEAEASVYTSCGDLPTQ